MIVRVKTKKSIFDTGYVSTFSRNIYQIIDKKVQKNSLKNLNTGQELHRICATCGKPDRFDLENNDPDRNWVQCRRCESW